jgi:hypothetical protein
MVRGGPVLDKAALVAALCAVASFAASQPEIESIEINPFLVQQQGGVALDALLALRG